MFTKLAIIDKIARNTSQNCLKFLLKSPICISKSTFLVSHMASKAMPKFPKSVNFFPEKTVSWGGFRPHFLPHQASAAKPKNTFWRAKQCQIAKPEPKKICERAQQSAILQLRDSKIEKICCTPCCTLFSEEVKHRYHNPPISPRLPQAHN